MAFLSPINLLYALSLAALVAIYLRARPRPSLEVSSLLLFDDLPVPAHSQRRLNADLMFWLEVIALSALTLAMAGLYLMLAGPASPARRHALIFDEGAAMGARESAGVRIDQAKRQALKIVSAAAAREQFSVIGYALEARVLQPATADRTAVRAAIDRLGALGVAARPAALAAALMLSREAEQTDLFADKLSPGAISSAGVAQARLRYHQVGSPQGNLAIVALDPGIAGFTKGHCTVTNLSKEARLCDLAIECAGERVTRSTVVLAPHAQTVVTFGPLRRGGLLHALILTPDALEADNQRYAYAPGGHPLSALIVSPDSSVRDDFARMLRAVDPDFVVSAADPEHADALLRAPAHFDLAVLHDLPPSRPPAGARLLVYPKQMAGQAVVRSVPYCELESGADGRPMVHPLFVGPVRVIKLPPWMRPIASGIGPGKTGPVPLAATGGDAEGRLGVLAFDQRDHRLLDPDMLEAFVLVVTTIRSLIAPAGLQIVDTGEVVSVATPRIARLLGPDGQTSRLEPDERGQVHFRPLLAGRYELQMADRRAEVFANYFDAAESNLAAGPSEMIKPVPAPNAAIASGAVSRSPRVVDYPLTALALAAIVLESALLARRFMPGIRADV